MKKVIFYVLLFIAFLITTYLILGYFKVSNFWVLMGLSFLSAYGSRKLISLIAYGNLKEKEEERK